MRTLNLTQHFDEMFRDLGRFTVGLEPTFRTLNTVRQSSANNFPPYDLEKIGDHQYRLTMAVAGFAPQDLTIEQTGDVLTVEGTAQTSEGNFLHKGIASRGFKRSFYLDQWISVSGSRLENGVLTVDFEQEIPEQHKPRRIEIDTTSKIPKISG